MTGPFEDAEERSLIEPGCGCDSDERCRKCDPQEKDPDDAYESERDDR